MILVSREKHLFIATPHTGNVAMKGVFGTYQFCKEIGTLLKIELPKLSSTITI